MYKTFIEIVSFKWCMLEESSCCPISYILHCKDDIVCIDAVLSTCKWKRLVQFLM